MADRDIHKFIEAERRRDVGDGDCVKSKQTLTIKFTPLSICARHAVLISYD